MTELKFPIEEPMLVVDVSAVIPASFQWALKSFPNIRQKPDLQKLHRPGEAWCLWEGPILLAQIQFIEVALFVTWNHPTSIPFAHEFYRLLNKNTVGQYQVQTPDWLKEQPVAQQLPVEPDRELNSLTRYRCTLVRNRIKGGEKYTPARRAIGLDDGSYKRCKEQDKFLTETEMRFYLSNKTEDEAWQEAVNLHNAL